MLGDLDKVAATSLSFFKHVRYSESYKDLPAFLFGESMGGLATMLMYFQSEPNMWTGLIFSAPLFVIPENMKPSKLHLFVFGLLFGMADTWAAMPDNKMVGKAIRDPEKLKIIAANPRRYAGTLVNCLLQLYTKAYRQLQLTNLIKPFKYKLS